MRSRSQTKSNLQQMQYKCRNYSHSLKSGLAWTEYTVSLKSCFSNVQAGLITILWVRRPGLHTGCVTFHLHLDVQPLFHAKCTPKSSWDSHKVSHALEPRTSLPEKLYVRMQICPSRSAQTLNGHYLPSSLVQTLSNVRVTVTTPKSI